MPPVSWLHRHLRVSPAFITRPSPPGLARSANCAWRTPVLQTVQGYRHRASSEAHRVSPGHSRVPPGTHRNLRVPPNTSGCSPNASGRSPALHPSRTGTFETHRTTRSSTDYFGCPPGRLRSPTRCVVFATSVLGCSPEPPGSTRVPSETQKPVRPNSPFNGDSIVSLQRTTRSKAPGRTVHRLWRHGGHFRVDPRLSSLLSTLNFAGPRQTGRA